MTPGTDENRLKRMPYVIRVTLVDARCLEQYQKGHDKCPGHFRLTQGSSACNSVRTFTPRYRLMRLPVMPNLYIPRFL